MKDPSSQIVSLLALFPVFACATVVTTSIDEDDGLLGGGYGVSLREAVKYSAPGSAIQFTASLSGRTIRLTRGEMVINRALTIDGSALSTRITLSGDRTGNGRTSDDCRIFSINDQIVVLDSLILSGASGFSTANIGGAIYASGHSVQLTVDRCTFSGNRSVSHGGAIYFYGAYQTTPETKLTVRNSTFTGNTATEDGGAVYAFGSLEIQNTTITGNKADRGGGIAIHQNTNAVIQHTTISGNTAIYSKAAGIDNSGSLTLWNSIVAGTTYEGITGAFSGYGNLTSGNPRLAPLGDYGGRTQTMPPLSGSPAIDKGNPNYRLKTDQRTYQRGVPDIGAVEDQGAADLKQFWKRDFDGDGTSYGAELALGTDPLLADSGSTRNLAPPTFDAFGHAVLRFGIGAAVPGTIWVLKRSPDLAPGSFVEIYRYDGSIDTTASGVTHQRTAVDITVTDANPPPGGAFYRFEAVFP